MLFSVLVGCSGDSAEIPVLAPEVAADEVTFGTLQDLGSFLFQSSVRDERTAHGRTSASDRAVALKWKDRDHWEYSELRDGKPVVRRLIYAGKAWSALDGGPLEAKNDPEPLRAQLALGWDPWEQVVAMTGGRISYSPAVDEVVDGRPALRHDVSLTAVADRNKRRSVGEALTPTALRGQVWIDKAHSVRVLADVVVEAASDDGLRARTLAVKLAVTDLGRDPNISPPTP